MRSRRVPGALLVLAAAIFLELPRAAAADLPFTGAVQQVSAQSISIRTPDGTVIEARLAEKPLPQAPAVAVGDEVRLACKKISPIWEEETSRYQFLEVTKLQLVRHGSPPKTAAAGQAAPAAHTDQRLEHAREVNLQYASRLPNYVADEIAKRYARSPKAKDWRYLDTIQAEVTVHGARATRGRVLRNGKATHASFERLPGFKWYGGFGTEIKPIFEPQCPTGIEYAGTAELGGRQVFDYRFHSPPHGCFVPFYFEYQRYNPARSGHVFLEDPTGRMTQFTEDATDFPPGFAFTERTEKVTWDYVKIGDTSHLLPVHAEFLVLYASGERWRVEVEYKNHRHFEASTNLVPLR